MSDRIQRFRFAATGRWAVSIKTYLLVFPFGYLVSIERELILNSITISRASIIALSGELAGFLYLFVAQSLFLGKRRQVLQPISKCFFVWATTGLVRGLVVAFFANSAFGYSVEVSKRIPGAVGYTTVVMALAAFYFGSIEKKRTELRALNSLGVVLSTEKVALQAASASNYAEANRVLQTQILPKVFVLKNGITRAIIEQEEAQSPSKVSELYESCASISQAIQKQRDSISSQVSIDDSTNENFKSISYWSSLIPNFLSIRLTSLFFILGEMSSQFQKNGWIGVQAGVLGLLPLLMFILPVSRLLKLKIASKSILLTIGFVGAFLISFIYNSAQSSIGFDLKYPNLPWYSALKTVYGLYFASVIASLIVDSSETHMKAVVSGTSKIKEVDLLDKQTFESEQILLEARFGALQGKISGVTMALHFMISNSFGSVSQDRKIELLTNANELLEESLSEIEKLNSGAT